MDFFTRDLKRKMFLIFFGIFIWWVFSNLELVGGKINLLFQALFPLIIGLIISFILNQPMMFFEERLFKNSKLKSKSKRLISFLITIIVFIVVIALILIIIIPNLLKTGVELKDKFPEYLRSVQEYIKDSSIKYSRFDQWIENINVDEIKDNIANFVKGGFLNWLGSTFSIASSVFGGIISFALGSIFSIYFLLQKEKLLNGLRKLLYLTFPSNFSNRILHIGSLTRKAFSEFILAQSLEALILGIMFFITMLIFRFPYSTMISVVIAVFSFIPIVGSFVGLFVGVILIFVESPKLAGLFIILFLVIQQIESNIIYPRVVGKLSGLSPLLTLVAVTLGGSLMGVIGIILFVPIFAVIQELFEEYMDNRPEMEKRR